MSLNSVIKYKGYLAELVLDVEDNIIVGLLEQDLEKLARL